MVTLALVAALFAAPVARAAPPGPDAGNRVDAGAAVAPKPGPQSVKSLLGARGAAACTDRNLIRASHVRGEKLKGSRRVPADGTLALEGAIWNVPAAIVLEKPDAFLRFDLGVAREISALLLQGDNNDVYAVSASLDGETYEPLWKVQPVPDTGLRTRQIKLPKPRQVRYLRVQGKGGDGFYSVSELQAFCKLPRPWPVALNTPPHHTGWKMLTNPMMVWLNAWLALAGLVVMLGLSVPYPGKRPLRYRAWLQLPLWIGGVGSLIAWWVLGEARWLQVGLAVLSLWFVLRWANGEAEGKPGWVQRAARAVVSLRFALPTYLVLVLAVAAGTFYYVDTHRKLPPRTVEHMAGILWAVGACAALALVACWIRWLRRPPSFRRAAHAMLLVVGLLSLSAWWNHGHFHFNHYIHIHEHYHYLLGAKYGKELRYTRLYDCTSVADFQDHLGKRVTERKIRALGTDNDMVTTEDILAHPERCTSHFTKERWESFRRDLRFLRGRFSNDRWNRSQTDHGYNATPVWAIAGRLITDAVGQLNWTKLYYLGALDSALLLTMWLVVLWAFGWQATCVALVFWGCNFPARYYWNGGGFLRYDYLMWLFVGISLLKRRRMFGAGVVLTYATGLRIFPGFIVAALVLKALGRMVAERRFVLSRAHAFFAAGCLATIMVLVPASDWAMGGLDAWGEFAHNSEKHLKTALTNNMGLKTALGWDWDSRARFLRNDKHLDPFKDWKAARAYFYAKRAPVLYVLIFLFCLLLARAGQREEDWVVACLGGGLIVVAAELTCYYYCFFAAYGLLWHRRRGPALLVVAYAAATGGLYQAFPWNDDHFSAMSLLAYLLVLGVTSQVAFGRRLPPEQLTAPAARAGG